MSRQPARYAIIGDPVAHSLSPQMQQAAFDASGILAIYEAIRVRREDVASAMERMRAEEYAGWNVTTPLKELILGQLDGLTAEAAESRSVNCVRDIGGGRYVGHDTDGNGFIRAVAELWDFRAAGKIIAIFGSGPAARSIARALERANVGRIMCWSRNRETADLIGSAPTRIADLVVAALPAGVEISREALGCIGEATDIFDCNYASAFVSVPERVGARRSDGIALLLHQGALSFEWWTRLPAPIDSMRAALDLTLKSKW